MEQINKKKHLIITSEFPYGSGETFLETEIIYLAKVFDKVIIISHNVNSSTKRKCPSNVEVIRVPYTLNRFGKIKSLLGFLDYNFWREIKYIKKVYDKSFSFGILKTMLISLTNAKRLKNLYSKILDEYMAEFLVLYSYWGNDSALALSLLKFKDQNIKCISRIHGWDVFFEPSAYNYLPYRNYISNHLDNIFSISQEGIEYCRTIWKVNTDNIKLSRLGVINQMNFQSIDLKDKKELLIVSCSNVIPLKRVDLIAKSLSMIKEIPIKWAHFGDGSSFDEVISIAKEKLTMSLVKFEFRGRVANYKVLNFYKKNQPDLFINLSTSEGVPVSIMEAMGFSIPVIATNVGGTSEIVNNDNGYLISSNPLPNEVAGAITNYYHLNLEEKNKKRLAAYNTWREKYNAEKNYTEFIDQVFSL